MTWRALDAALYDERLSPIAIRLKLASPSATATAALVG